MPHWRSKNYAVSNYSLNFYLIHLYCAIHYLFLTKPIYWFNRAFRLPVAYVVHTVGPIYDMDRHPDVSLRNAYK